MLFTLVFILFCLAILAVSGIIISFIGIYYGISIKEMTFILRKWSEN